MLDSILESFTSMSPTWLFLALFLMSYLENVLPPVPGDTIVVFAAYLVGRSQQHLLGVLCSTTLGSVAGFMTYYLVGRLVPSDYFTRRDFRLFPAARFEKVGRWFQSYGYWILLANRFLSGVRSIISLVSGIYRLPWHHVLALAAVSCAVWNGMLIWAGYALGSNWRVVEKLLATYSRGLFLVALALGIGLLVRQRIRQRRRR